MDARYEKVRREGVVRDLAVLWAMGVNDPGGIGGVGEFVGGRGSLAGFFGGFTKTRIAGRSTERELTE